MQPENEGQKSKPGMSEVSRNGDSDRLRDMRGDGLESEQQRDLRGMRGQGIPRVRGPNSLRYYLGAVAVGMGVGISWALTLTDGYAARHLSRVHANMILWGMVGVVFAFQTFVLIAEGRRLRREGKALKEFYEAQDQEFKDFCKANGLDPKGPMFL